MLDQDTARALVTIADETGARVALVGDRHQLPAVGRGGVLDLAHRQVHPDARVDLDTVHRFVHTVDGRTAPDTEYAQLSLAMRAGDNPAAVFDALHARGHITVHASELERRDALAARVAARRLGGVTTSVVVDTHEHAATLNAAIRDRLVAAGAVDDHRVAVTTDGQRVGAGDVIVTRRNDPTFGVANRETWTVTRVHRDSELTATDRDRGTRELTADYVRKHVELGYATTGYGAQGDTTAEAHLVLTDTTTAAATYVAMTRGHEANTAHLVADDVDDAREQWVTAFSRDRADLGPAAAGRAAERAAGGYTPAGQPPDPDTLADVLHELRDAWSARLTAHWQLQRLQERLARVQAQAAWEALCQQTLAPLETLCDAVRVAAQQAEQAATGCATVLAERAEQHTARLRRTWDAQLPGADQAARTIAAGPGRLGMHRGRVRDAKQHLDAWAATWSPMVVDGDLDLRQLARRPVAYPSTVPQVAFALHQHAQRLAAAEHPDQATRLGAARQARARYDAVAASYHQARRQLEQLSHQPVYDTGAAELIPDLTDRLAAAGHRVAAADQRVQRLSADPAIIGQPDPDALLETARATWNAEQIVDHQQRAFRPSDTARSIRHEPHPTPQIDHGPSIGR
jgi:exodeoxyribonuclease V alpha subunit